jgi:hypothetical protein
MILQVDNERVEVRFMRGKYLMHSMFPNYYLYFEDGRIEWYTAITNERFLDQRFVFHFEPKTMRVRTPHDTYMVWDYDAGCLAPSDDTNRAVYVVSQKEFKKITHMDPQQPYVGLIVTSTNPQSTHIGRLQKASDTKGRVAKPNRIPLQKSSGDSPRRSCTDRDVILRTPSSVTRAQSDKRFYRPIRSILLVQ